MPIPPSLDRRLRAAEKYLTLPRRRHTLPRYASPPARTRLSPLILLPLALISLLVYASTRDPQLRRGSVYVPFASPTKTTPGVSLIAACANRTSHLLHSLSTWQAAHPSEIVLIDWHSVPALAPTARPVRLIRVLAEDWSLSRSYNLAASLAKFDWLLRLDCDVRLEPQFFTHIANASDGEFWAGNWQVARDPEETHLNGALLVQRAAFEKVGGYDERIRGYGFDDEELYGRLESAGYGRRVLDYDYMTHVSHDATRATLDDVRIDYHAILLRGLAAWNGTGRTSYLVQHGGNALLLSENHVPPGLDALADESTRSTAWAEALGRRLHDGFDVPWDVMHDLPLQQREALLRRLRSMNDTRPGRLLIAHVAHGLGNRLRALASALAFARKTNRVPVVVWERDVHCRAAFSELFESDIVVVESIAAEWPFRDAAFYDAAWRKWDLYNYMTAEGGSKDKPVVDGLGNVYFRGAYVMMAPRLTGWDAANAELRALKPVSEVLDEVRKVAQRLQGSVGVHIRHLDTRGDIAGVNASAEYGDFESRVIGYWRAASAPTAFIPELHRVIRETGLRDIFVAVDDDRWRKVLETEFGERVWSLGGVGACGGSTGREGTCVRRALVDMLALAKCQEVLGSMWSSFTEGVSRFSGKRVRMAGVEFGARVNGFGKDVDRFVDQVLAKRKIGKRPMSEV